jgi:hypothetical protein
MHKNQHDKQPQHTITTITIKTTTTTTTTSNNEGHVTGTSKANVSRLPKHTQQRHHVMQHRTSAPGPPRLTRLQTCSLERDAHRKHAHTFLSTCTGTITTFETAIKSSSCGMRTYKQSCACAPGPPRLPSVRTCFLEKGVPCKHASTVFPTCTGTVTTSASVTQPPSCQRPHP